jgi:diguanylate cyclase (GGDEF)-like protein/PAS domain S-box-containing protein
MVNWNAIGLMLRDQTERRIVRDAAVNCGLEPVEVTEPDPGLLYRSSLGSDRYTEQAGLGNEEHRWLPLIVADEQSPLSGWQTVVQAKSVWSSAIVMVRDQVRPWIRERAAAASQPDSSYAWVLERPLRRESVETQIQQAVRANRVFLGRYHEVMEDLYRSRTVFDSVTNGISLCDATKRDLPLVYVNPAFERMSGYMSNEVLGKNCRFLQGEDKNQPALDRIREAIQTRKPVEALLRNYRKDGTLFWNELHLSPIAGLDGKVTHFVGVQNDVTERVEATRALETLAHYDALTGLANRSLVLQQLTQAVVRARRCNQVVAVLVFDLEGFKQTNDLAGREAADRLLTTIAARLRESARRHETVARLEAMRGVGGDEFVVVLEGLRHADQHEAIARRFIQRLGEPCDFQGATFHPSAKLGVALYPRDGETGEELLRVAEAAASER